MAALAISIAVFVFLFVLYCRENKSRDSHPDGTVYVEGDLVNAFSYKTYQGITLQAEAEAVIVTTEGKEERKRKEKEGGSVYTRTHRAFFMRAFRRLTV